MPEGIKFVIEVDDKGSIKVKQFGEESKKAFDEIQKGPKAAQGPLNDLKESWIGLTAKVAIATAAFYAAKRMIYDTAVEIASTINAIERQAKVLGISTGEFQEWQYAAKMSDVNAQEFAIGLKMLSRNMEDVSTGAGEIARYFSAMGISVKDSSGHLRPLNDVMGDIMDKFASWEDGPRKIAIAMQLFGRSGEALIPLLNKGRTGFNELAKEAEKLGIILSPELIKKGSEAEDIFKKIEAQITATKLSLGPLILEFAKDIDTIVNDLKKLFTMEPPLWLKILWGLTPVGQAGVAKGWLRDIDERIGLTEKLIALEKKLGIQPETPYRRITDPKDRTSRLTKPPAIGEKAKTEEIEKTILEFNKLLALAELFSKEGKMPSWLDAIEEHARPVIRDINDLDLELNKLLATTQLLSREGGMPSWLDVLEELPKGAAIKEWEEHIAAGIERAKDLHAFWLEERTQISEWEKAQQEAWENVSKSWSYHVSNILKGTESLSDGLKNLFKGIADAFISEVTKMITKWLIFDVILKQSQGTTQKGSGGGGGWGGIAGFLTSVIGAIGLHKGGIVGEPSSIRYVPAEIFSNARRYHDGLMPDEYPAVLKKGEGVFTPEQMKALRDERKTELTIINVVDSRQLDHYLASSAGQNAVLNVIGSRAGEIRRILS